MFARNPAAVSARHLPSRSAATLCGCFLLVLLASRPPLAGAPPTETPTPTVTPTSTPTPTPTMTNTFTPTPTSTRVADLDLTMSASPEPVQSGQTLTYTQVLVNRGPAQALGIHVSDPLPPQVAFVSCSITGFGYSGAGCAGGSSTFSNMGWPATATITITTTVNAASGTITNTATVTSLSIDPNPSNDTATVVSTIGSSPPQNFYALTPCRVVDTRRPAGPYGAPSLAAGTSRTFVLGGQCNIPSTAVAVALNVIAVQPDAPGFLTFFAGGTTQPPTSTVNYKIGSTRANNAIVALGSLQDVTAQSGQTFGKVDLVIDVTGYFAP